MASYDWSSILKKAQAASESESVQQKIDSVVDDYMLNGKKLSTSRSVKPVRDAAIKFAEVLSKEIHSCAGSVPAAGQLGQTAISALSSVKISTPVKTSRNHYEIGVSFSGDMSRESLDPSYFPDGIDNIAALLNNGYSARATVYGVWLNHSPWNIKSLTSRTGAHFIDNAVQSFKTGDSAKYGITNIEVDEIYK